MEPVSSTPTTPATPALDFGIALKRARKAAGLTQAELAERAGFSLVYIGMLERGARQPQRTTVALLADALCLAVSDRAALETAARLPSAPLPLKRRAKAVTETSRLPVGGFLGALPTGQLVGRKRELELITDTLEAVAAGHGRLLVLVGEPGVGKTRLAQEIALQARVRDYRVLTGRCYEPQQRVAYFPFLDTLSEAMPFAQGNILSPVAERWPDVARLLPDQLASVLSPIQLDDGNAQQRLFWQVGDLLKTLSKRNPVALLLDDLQWADRASLDLLLHLARYLRDRPILLVGTAREIEAQHQPPLLEALSELRREELLEQLAVRPLAADATSALIEATLAGVKGAAGGTETVAPELARRVFERSEGNAFFTRQLAIALHEQEELQWVEGQWRLSATSASAGASVVKAPESIRVVIGQRLARLTPLTQDVLREASVLGQVFIFGELQHMNHRGEQEVEEALEEAAEAGVLREGAPDHYHFNHALTVETLAADLSPRRTRRLHRAAADALERSPGHKRRAAELAYHLLAADEEARALPYAVLAGDQAEAVYAHAEAEGHYHRAIKLTQKVGDARTEATALEKRMRALYLLNRLRDALETGAQGLAVCDALGDIEGEARMVWLLGWVYIRRETPQEGVMRLAPLVEDLRKRGVSPRAVIHLQLVLIRLWDDAGRDETFGQVAREALVTAEQVLAVARSAPDPTLLTDALGIFSRIAATLGNDEAELRALEEVVALDAPTGEAWSQIEWQTIPVYAVKTLAALYTMQGRFEKSWPLHERALAEALHTGNLENVGSVYESRGWNAFFAGDWARARSDFMHAEAAIRKSSAVSGPGSYQLFILSVAEGSAEAESVELHDVLAREVKAHHFNSVCRVHSALGERDLLYGQVQSARDRLLPLLASDPINLHDDNRIILLKDLAWVNLALGDRARAEEQVAECKARIEATGWHLWLVDALRVEALIRSTQRRWAEAKAALDEALDRTRAMPYPYAEAKALWVYGRLEATCSNPSAARKRFTQARSICDQLGEGLYRTHIERDLAQL
jgi:transcriptional regulator with XRE-family HTH domain/tetratricopeptide (TPR) repeat protein